MSDEETVTIVADAATADPEAPYGRLKNGRARKTPPPGAAKKTAAPSAPRARKGPPKGGGAKRKVPDFTRMIQAGVQMVGSAVMGLGARREGPAGGMLLADGMAVQLHAAPIAKGLNEIAQQSPAVQRILTQTGPALPYVGIVTALVGLGAQLAANHGKVLPGMPVEDPQTLANAAAHRLMQEAEQQQRQQPQARQEERQEEQPPQHEAPPQHGFVAA